MGADVKVVSGVPTVAMFATGNFVPCSPLVINSATGVAYVLKAGVVTPLTQSGAYTAGATAQVGYVSIVCADGVTRKFLVG